MIFRICRFLISSVKLLQQEQTRCSSRAAAVSVFRVALSACCGMDDGNFNITFMRPFSPELLLDLIEFLYRWQFFLCQW
jgi:hypothetical protein